MRLSPARRVLYGVAVVAALLGLILLFRGFGPVSACCSSRSHLDVPMPQWADGTLWLVARRSSRLNLLILMEVADRLSLKGELEIARDIQLAMLPDGHAARRRRASCAA